MTESPQIQSGQLYNVVEDPFETNDLWEKEPGVVNELGALLKTCKSEYCSNKIGKK